jgi:hypothetical protein
MLQGALIGLIIGLGMAIVFWWIASKKKPSFDLPAARSETFSVGLDPAAAIAKIAEAASAMGLSVALSDTGANRVLLDEPTSITNYGSYLRVSAAGDRDGAAVTVDLVNKAPQWGPVVTKKHRLLTEKVKGALGAGAAVA